MALQSTYGQFTCEVILPTKKSAGPLTGYLNYIPDSNTPIQYIRVNFHFMLLEDSHADAPSNFTKDDDGRGNTDFTGYDWIDDLLSITNQRLGSNPQMRYPLGNSTSILSRKYRLVLNGVFFHKSNTYHDFTYSPMSLYSENLGEAINIFFQSDGTLQSHGYANMSSNRYSVFANKWDVYDDLLDQGEETGNWANSAGIMHETGHNLSLHHTVMLSGGSCCYSTTPNCDDHCTDTPTREYVIATDGVDPCQSSQWNNPLNSNNVMDYSGETSITPEQLGRVHWTIENEMQEYLTCYFSTSSKNITSFSDNESFIAETVTIPSTSNIVVDDSESLYASCEQFVIDGTLEIEQGSLLLVQCTESCN